VLRDDGTVWLNLGDAYTSGNRATRDTAEYSAHGLVNRSAGLDRARTPAGLKPKDLMGIPWRVAFALQADGWYLRSDIVWAKGVSFCPSYSGSVMPEPVRDRPTRAHEYLFLLSKSSKYYYDADAVKEPARHAGTKISLGAKSMSKRSATGLGVKPSGNALADSWTVGTGRNLRSVWTIKTQPNPDAHFATFPTALVEPCVKAGSRVGDLVCDPFCGSGTTGIVAKRLGRQFAGIELNPAYVTLAERDLAGPLFDRGSQ